VKRLTINKKLTDGVLNVQLIGSIDEDADLSEILETKASHINFDFNQVELINSCGIREWIKFLDLLSCESVQYENCPQIIIEQINMVHGFIRPGSRLKSFYAPYYCEECDQERKSHIMSSDVKNKKAPKVNCPDCGNEMEFDALEASYFNFLGK